MTDAPRTAAERIECKPTKDPVVRLFILAAMLIGFGVYCYLTRVEKPTKTITEDLNTYLSWAMGEYLPIVLTPPGLLVGVLAVMASKRRLVADGEGIGYVGKEKVAWSAITAVDAARLQTKGLLDIHYGAGKSLLLCDWKLTDFKPMVAFLEAHLPAGVTVKTK
ncbi:MAG: hypothetical protein NT031_14705 [Planctomycetota bacterium]|nr:hypothetical protein [Planctomycetota bacterium]